MMAFIKFMNESGVVGWTILLTGLGSLILVAERAKMLYKEYGMNSDEFMGKIQNLVLAKKLDEALLLCAQLEKKPLAAFDRSKGRKRQLRQLGKALR